VNDVVIDLGELPHGTQARVRSGGSRAPLPVRPMLIGLTVVLVAMLTGAVRAPGPVRPTIIPARQGDVTFAVRDRYFVVAAADERATSRIQNKIVNVYALPAGTLLSRTPVTVSGAITNVDAIGDVVLVSQQLGTVGGETTVAVAGGTGRVLWQQASRLVRASPSGRIALLADNVRGVGPLSWYGVDPHSGVPVWSQEQPQTGNTDLSYGAGDTPTRLVTAAVDGQLLVRDPETGTVTASAVVPTFDEWRRRGLNVWTVDDLVLLGGSDGITAYDLTDLRPRWHNDIDLTQVFVLPVCGDAICLFGRFGGLKVLDPATGLLRWGTDRWAVARRVGPYLLTSGNDRATGQQPLVVVDAADGRERGSLGIWQPVGEPLPDGRIVGTRDRLSDTGRLWFALLDPAALTVQVLGAADSVTGDCQVSADVLICRRLDSSVGLWPLPAR
jgi:outer membrane protein assembly factor BamB